MNGDRVNSPPEDLSPAPRGPAQRPPTEATVHPGYRWAGFYDGLIEATWLGAVVITAVFFNHLTYRSFEPDKAELLRLLAFIAAMAWGLRSLAGTSIGSVQGRGSLISATDAAGWLRRLSRVPLLMPAFALWLSMLLSTLLSVDWQVSLLGNYPRSQGLYTASAYLVIFVAVLQLMRSHSRFDRLVTTLVLAAIPVAILGLMQYQGIDPIRWSDPRGNPVVSTMGNTIFVAAWLVMIVPLLLHRLAAALAAANRTLPTFATLLATATVVGLIGILLLVWPRSLAAAAAASLAGLALLLSFAWLFRSRPLAWLQVWGYAVVLAAVVACILLTERRGPFLGLLTGVFLFALLRLTIVRRWRAALGMIGAAVLVLLTLIGAPSVAPSLIEDTPFERLTRVLETGGSAGVRLNVWQSVVDLSGADGLRSIVGYGPDTLHLVIPPFSVPEIASGRESTVDRAHSHTLDLLAGNGLLGLAAYTVFIFGLVMLGLRSAGLIRGAQRRRRFLAASVLAALAYAITVRTFDDSWRLMAIGLPAALLFAAIIAILARSLREARRGRPIVVASRCIERQRWSASLFSALIAHLVEVHVGIATVATQTVFWVLAAMLVIVAYRRAPFEQTLPVRQESLFSVTLVVGLIIVTMAFNFPLRHLGATHSTGILWLFGLLAVLAGAIVLVDIWNAAPPGQRRATRWMDLGVYVSFVLLVFSVAGFAFSLSAAHELPPIAPLWAYLGIGSLLLVALAFTLAPGVHRNDVADGRRWIPVMGTGLLMAVTAVVVPLQQRPLHADALYKRGLMGHQRHGRYEEAARWYGHALALAPGQDHYHLHLGLALAGQAKQQGDAVRRDRLYEEGVAEIEEAMRLRPLHAVYPEGLARLYLGWAMSTDDPKRSERRLRRALQVFEEARIRNPNRSDLWTHWGDAYTALGEHDSASEKYRQAVSLDGDSLPPRIALARSLQQQGFPHAARQEYEQVIELQPDTGYAHAAAIQLHLQRSDCADALAALVIASEVLPDDPAVLAVAREVAELCPR